MASALGQSTLTTGVSGSGKSYKRCARFLVDEFLPYHRGVHWSNFPIGKIPNDHRNGPEYPGQTFMDRMAAAVAKAHGGKVEQYRRRMGNIPEEELIRWRAAESGPWDFFQDIDLSAAHIAIDEVHNYCGTGSDTANQRRWLQWIGEARHEGATVELLTQKPGKVYSKIVEECEVRFEMITQARRRDPLTGVLYGDWYELRSGLLGFPYRPTCWEVEYRQIDKGWTEERKQQYALDPYYYRFYDSYSASQAGGKKGRAAQKPHEFMTKPQLLRWFAARNGLGLVPRFAAVAVIYWLVIMGGFVDIMHGGIGMIQRAMIHHVDEAGEAGQSDQAAEVVTAAAAPGPEYVTTEAEREYQADQDDQAGEDVTMTAQLAAVIEAQTQEMRRLRERVEELETERARGELMGISRSGGPGEVIMSDGRRYRPGDTIGHGDYTGRVVAAINWVNREARLDDGTILTVRRAGDALRMREQREQGRRGESYSFIPGRLRSSEDERRDQGGGSSGR